MEDKKTDTVPQNINKFTVKDRQRIAVRFILFIALYCGGAGIGLEMSLWQQKASLLWPSSGLSIAAVLLFGYIYLIPVAIAAFLVEIFQGSSFIYASCILIAYTFSTYLGASLLKKVFKLRNSLERRKDVFGFLLVGVIISTLVSSIISTSALCWLTPDYWLDFKIIWSIRWLGDSLGMLVVAPMMLAWFTDSSIKWSNRQALEIFIWLVSIVFVGMLVFGNWAPTDTLRYPLELALFPVLAWAAIRFGQRGASAGIVIISIMAVWELSDVMGPEALKFHSQSPPFLWVFVGILSATALFLGSILTEHRKRESIILQNEQRLLAFIDAMPDIAFVISESGRYEEIFASKDSTFAKRAPLLKGKYVKDIWPKDQYAKVQNAIHNAIKSDHVQVIQYTLPFEGKDIRWFEGRLAAMEKQIGPEKSVIWMAYDITDRKKAEEALKYRDSLLQGVANAETNLLTTKDLDTAIYKTLDTVGKSANVDRLYIFENIKNQKTNEISISKRYNWSLEKNDKDTDISEMQYISYERELPGWYETLSKNGIIKGFNKDISPDVKEWFINDGAKSILVGPISRDNEYWGIMAIGVAKANREWEESEIAALISICASLGGYLESKTAEEKLKKAKDTADSANLAKGEFLAMMSHEIRTPMNAILGFADLLMQTDMETSQQEYLKIINRSGKALLELINNILDYSKIESRSIELEVAPFKLENTLLEALELVLVKARQKGITLDYNIEDSYSGLILGDSHRLKQVILNIVNNAVKFTEEGKVFVNVKSTKLEKGNWEFHFSIQDSGTGIKDEKLDRLFKPFSQVDSSTTRKFGGTGLGLVICKRLVEKMGGKIWVESEPGVGSNFQFTIICHRTKSSTKSNLLKMDSSVNVNFAKKYPLKILLAEDDPTNQRVAIEILKKIGYAVTVVDDGLQAVEKVKDENFNVVLMDIQMPELDGLEATQKIRAGDCGVEKKDLYIVAMTAFALNADKEKFLQIGMNAYLPKPFLISQMKETLVNAFNEHN